MEFNQKGKKIITQQCSGIAKSGQIQAHEKKFVWAVFVETEFDAILQ